VCTPKKVYHQVTKWPSDQLITLRYDRFGIGRILCKFIFTLGRCLKISMNEFNIKYWFRNFQKKKFIDFLDEFEEKPICTKKKFPSIVCPEMFSSPHLPFPFNLETSPFGLVNDWVPNRSYWFLDFGNKFRREAPIRIFGSFFTSTRKIANFNYKSLLSFIQIYQPFNINVFGLDLM
jgi:hypothetical protein